MWPCCGRFRSFATLRRRGRGSRRPPLGRCARGIWVGRTLAEAQRAVCRPRQPNSAGPSTCGRPPPSGSTAPGASPSHRLRIVAHHRGSGDHGGRQPRWCRCRRRVEYQVVGVRWACNDQRGFCDSRCAAAAGNLTMVFHQVWWASAAPSGPTRPGARDAVSDRVEDVRRSRRTRGCCRAWGPTLAGP